MMRNFVSMEGAVLFLKTVNRGWNRIELNRVEEYLQANPLHIMLSDKEEGFVLTLDSTYKLKAKEVFKLTFI